MANTQLLYISAAGRRKIASPTADTLQIGQLALGTAAAAITMPADGVIKSSGGQDALTVSSAGALTTAAGVTLAGTLAMGTNAISGVTDLTLNGAISGGTTLGSSGACTLDSGASGSSFGGALTLGGALSGVTTIGSSGAATLDSGGAGSSFGGNLTVTGDLIVNGDTITVNTATMSVEDPLIELGKSNGADSVDLGFYANYNDGAGKFGGFFRDADDGVWKLFDGLTVEPTTTVGATGYDHADFQLGGLTVDDAATVGGTLDVTGAFTVGGGYGDTGLTVTGAGVVTTNGAFTSDGAVTGGTITDGTASLNAGALTGLVSFSASGACAITGTGTLAIGGATIGSNDLAVAGASAFTGATTHSGGMLSDSLDAATATSLTIGAATATALTLGASDITTTNAGTLSVGSSGSGKDLQLHGAQASEGLVWDSDANLGAGTNGALQFTGSGSTTLTIGYDADGGGAGVGFAVFSLSDPANDQFLFDAPMYMTAAGGAALGANANGMGLLASFKTTGTGNTHSGRFVIDNSGIAGGNSSIHRAVTGVVGDNASDPTAGNAPTYQAFNATLVDAGGAGQFVGLQVEAGFDIAMKIADGAHIEFTDGNSKISGTTSVLTITGTTIAMTGASTYSGDMTLATSKSLLGAAELSLGVAAGANDVTISLGNTLETSSFVVADSAGQVQFQIDGDGGVEGESINVSGTLTNTANKLADEATIKAYVDAQVGGIDTIEELNDVTISGEAAGHMLLAQGADDWQNKAMSGDGTLSLAGAFALTATTNATLVTASALTTVSALNSGSITSGFGSIDNGASAITTTGLVTAGTFTSGGDVDLTGTGGSTGAADFDVAGYAQFAGVVEFDGTVQFDSTVAFNADTTFGDDVGIQFGTGEDASIMYDAVYDSLLISLDNDTPYGAAAAAPSSFGAGLEGVILAAEDSGTANTMGAGALMYLGSDGKWRTCDQALEASAQFMGINLESADTTSDVTDAAILLAPGASVVTLLAGEAISVGDEVYLGANGKVMNNAGADVVAKVGFALTAAAGDGNTFAVLMAREPIVVL